MPQKKSHLVGKRQPALYEAQKDSLTPARPQLCDGGKRGAELLLLLGERSFIS
jgi:hypothetical protein